MRDYCQFPFEPAEIKKPETPVIDIPPKKTPDLVRCDCQTCAQTCLKKEKDDDEHRQLAIDFEDEIQDFVYVRQETSSDMSQNRAKRQIVEFPDNEKKMEPETTKVKTSIEKDPTESKRDNVTNDFVYFYKVINDITQTTFELHNLTHFTKYQIFVKACREKIERNNTNGNEQGDKETLDECGPEAQITELTQRKEENDDITDLEAIKVTNSNSSLGTIRLSWKEPKSPNGAILSYTIRYRKNDIENTKHESLCITQKQFKNNSNLFILDKLANGNYTIQVAANSMAGSGNFSSAKPIVINNKENSHIWYLSIAFFILLSGLVIFIFYLKRYYSNSMSASMKLIASVNPDYHGVHYKQDSYEVPRDKVIQLHELGQGSFGMVYEGIIRDIVIDGGRTIEEMRCAIKTVNENATDKERISFLNEASIMKQFDTAFVVKLLGVVSQGQPTFVIMELMVRISNNKLRKHHDL